MSDISLTGISPTDPLPALYSEIRFAQGLGNATLPGRTVLLYGNKTAAGSETVDSIDLPVQDRADVIARFGARSEARWMWEAYNMITQQSTVYICAPTEASAGGGATAATRLFTFATAASGGTTLYIEWAGRQTSVGISSGDTAVAQAALVVAAILDWEEGGVPFTAAVGSSPNDHIITVTAANLGDRGKYVLDGIRMRYESNVSTTITHGTTTNGSGSDDHTAAFAAALAKGRFYYQANPKFTTSSPSSTDNGVGEGATYITTAALPANGKRQQMFFGLVGTQAQATTVATAVNNPRVKFFWAENSPMFPGMIAALHMAIISRAEMAHAGANVNGYTTNAAIGQLYPLPAPYSLSDYPTRSELVACANNGICGIEFDERGRPKLVRHVTSYSLNGSSNDYRVREGHIPSAQDDVMDTFLANYQVQKEALPIHAAKDLVRGQKPLPGTMYPSFVKGLMSKVIRDKAGGDGTRPVLDPDSVEEQVASITVEATADGYNARANTLSVRHNNKGGFLFLESGPSY